MLLANIGAMSQTIIQEMLLWTRGLNSSRLNTGVLRREKV